MKVSIDFEVKSEEAFRMLCKTLYMECVLDEDTPYFIKKKKDGTNGVYIKRNNMDCLYDERGDLFVALRNVAVNIFPNVSFRNDDYIYTSEKDYNEE